MIVPTLARLLVREHLYKPIGGKVLTLGRQTIAMSYQQVIELLQQEGYELPERVLRQTAITYDHETGGAKELGRKRGVNYITDGTFFGLLGIKELFTLDVSGYEKADIVHDLNMPIPESLCGQFDFIIDGGTFDHLFDIRVAFENVVKLLRTGGRVFQWNAASNCTGAAYLSFGPDLFYDYYVLNQFADCKVYVVEVDSLGQSEAWEFYQFEGARTYAHFQSDRIQMVIVLAEKGPHSTWDRMPIQAQYRDADLWQPYQTTRKAMLSSGREPFTGSRSGHKLAKAKREVKRGVEASTPSLISMLIPKLKEKGVVYCLKVGTDMLSERLYKYRKTLYTFLKRKTRITKGRKLKGFIYRGQI